MHTLPRLISSGFILCLASGLCAQSPQTAAPPQADITQNTRLVTVDVIVEDKDGHPVHGLKAEDFHLSEGKTPQTLRHFEEHAADPNPAPGPQLPKLPAGTFTNYTPVAPNGTLNVLLLDALNTPMTDQSYVRNQLQKYVNHAPPGTRIAIFGLANRLILLQGFTSDPETLKDVVNRKLIPRASALLDDPAGTGTQPENLSDSLSDVQTSSASAASELAALVANLQQFEAETAALEVQNRIRDTLDAFNALGHYLASFPGRKNLIWFSGSFPINILPDPTIKDPFAVTQINEDEFRETTNLLSKAQVAVYPIDARGLMMPPSYVASYAGKGYGTSPSKALADLHKFDLSQAAEHTTMQSLADDTGGHAFYNTNDLADAVTKAITSGASYYTLAYSPTDRKLDGNYRSIRITVSSQPKLKLSYRQGYYADTPHMGRGDQTATTAEADRAQLSGTLAYQRSAMARGAPLPQDIVFKVRVLPASNVNETAIVPGNILAKNIPASGPFRRYAADFVAPPGELTFTSQPNGIHTGKLEFLIFVYDTDGKLLNSNGRAVVLNLPPDVYSKFLQTPIHGQLQVSVPTHGEAFLRIGIRDVPSNRFGAVEIPVASVSHLSPAADAPAQVPPAH